MKILLWLYISMAFMSTLFGAGTSAPPYFNSGQAFPALVDDSPPGTFCYQFQATDQNDPKLTLTYSLDNIIQEWLEIDGPSGNTTVKKKIDREAMLSIKTFKVYATNTKSEKGEQEIQLTITDVNNKPPIMTNIPFIKNVAEDTSIGAVLYPIAIDDKDEGVNGYLYTKLTFNSGNEDGTFRIEGTNIILNHTLDFDNGKKQYILNITARNIQAPHPETSGVLTINVLNIDDLGLNFTKQSYEGQVIQGSGVNTSIVQVEAEDLDHLNETAEYQIFPGSNPGNRYAISSNGQITVNSPTLELGSQTLVVLAKSKKHGFAITFVNITVVDVLTIPFEASVKEDQANVVIMDLTTTESSFISASGCSFTIESGKYKDLFTIDGTKLKVGSTPLDRETLETYSIVVRLKKSGTLKGQAKINVKVDDINDNTPQFKSSSYDVTVKEHLPVGSNIVQVVAMDTDKGANGSVKYAIINQQDLFAIDNSTGQISISGILDREKASSHVITVQAYDGGSPSRTNSTNVTINVQDINDNSPVINPVIVNANVNENVNAGFKVVTIVAIDDDQDQNAKISYSIQSGDEGHFTINSITGDITTIGQLSYKLKPNYTIIVIAKDNGTSPRSTKAFVIVSVHPVFVNNHKPIFEPSTYLGGVFKETSYDKVVLTVSAVDGDSGTYGKVQYQLIKDNDLFFIDTNDGSLKTIGSFTDKEGEKYTLTVQANDMAQPSRASDPNAIINVLVLRDSHSVDIRTGVSQTYLFNNLQEFQRVLDDLTNRKAFIKRIRPGSEVNTSIVMFNAVDVNNTREMTYDEIARILGSDEKQNLITGKYQKWFITYGRPQTGARTTQEGGLSAVVGALVCLAVMIGVGGIIMIIILIKKKRERERVRKAARVTFNDKPQFIDPIIKSMGGRKIENAQQTRKAKDKL